MGGVGVHPNFRKVSEIYTDLKVFIDETWENVLTKNLA